MDLPTFAPYRATVRPEFYVHVAWPDGAVARINHFGTFEDAQGWIARESANWLRTRTQARARADGGENRTALLGFPEEIVNPDAYPERPRLRKA